MGSISREKQNLCVPETDLVAAAPFAEFPRADVFSRIAHFFETIFSHLCRIYSFCINELILHKLINLYTVLLKYLKMA